MYIEKNLKDLVGKKFGSWTVLCPAPSISRNRTWKCKCDCGTEKDVMQKYLLSGKSKSCGCIKRKQGEERRSKLLGRRFGRLTVIEILPYDPKDRISYVKCVCDCGNEHTVSSFDIHKIKSCPNCCNTTEACVGSVFGKLVVIEMLYHHGNNRETYCLCDCECGNKNYITRLNGLKTGNTSSCGCIHSPSLIGNKFGYLTVIEEVKSKNKQRMWKCLCNCGQTTELSSHLLTSGHTASCGCLRSEKVSRREIFIAKYFKDNNVVFETQKTYFDCKGIGNKPLRYDFYIPSINTLIEYDGCQHFKPIKYWGGEKSFKVLQQNDNIKNEYCKINSIPLIRLPYTLSDIEIITIINSLVFENPVTTTVS